MNNCRAKNPSKCRYHGSVMRVEAAIVAGDYNAAINAYFDARKSIEPTRVTYSLKKIFESTPSGETEGSKEEVKQLHEKIMKSFFHERDGKEYPISLLRDARKYGSSSGLSHVTITDPKDVETFEKFLENYPNNVPGSLIRYDHSYGLPGGGKVFEGISYVSANPTVWKDGTVALAKTQKEYDSFYADRPGTTLESALKKLNSASKPKKEKVFGNENSPFRRTSSGGYQTIISSSPKKAEKIMEVLREANNTDSVRFSFEGIIDLADGNKMFINPRYSYAQRDASFIARATNILESSTDSKKYDDIDYFEKNEKSFGLKF